MFVDFIEVGTSDFDTEIQKMDTRIGLSIEPIKYYLDRLPNKYGCTKLNIAISNTQGKSKVYYVKEENIKKYDLPHWVRGCNSMGKYHPTVEKLLSNKGLNPLHIIDEYDVDVKTLMDVVEENKINSIYYLKIDTEGHDTYILEKYGQKLQELQEINRLKPHMILFESNELNDQTRVMNILEQYGKLGYDVVSTGHDVTLQLNLSRLTNKTGFGGEVKRYYIMNYPPNYDISKLPHENTLSGAMKYCTENGCCGVTYQNGIYQVRNGPYLKYYDNVKLLSWIYM
jgi:FkbM family methyltransferase